MSNIINMVKTGIRPSPEKRPRARLPRPRRLPRNIAMRLPN